MDLHKKKLTLEKIKPSTTIALKKAGCPENVRAAKILCIAYRVGFARDVCVSACTCLDVHDSIVRVSLNDTTARIPETLYGGAVVLGGSEGTRRSGGGSARVKDSSSSSLALKGGGGGTRRGGDGSGRGESSSSSLALRGGGGGPKAVVTFPVASSVFLGCRLHVAAARGNAHRISHLLSLSCSPEVRDSNYATPLLVVLRAFRDSLISFHLAVDCLHTLLSLGADVGACYTKGFNQGESAFHTALTVGGREGSELAFLLLRFGKGRGLGAVSLRTGATPIHLALRGGKEEPFVEPERGRELLPLIQAMCDTGGVDTNAVLEELVGTGGRVVAKRPLDVLVQRLLDAPVSVPGWPYTGVREWRDVADALISAGAKSSACLEETRVWLRKAGL